MSRFRVWGTAVAVVLGLATVLVAPGPTNATPSGTPGATIHYQDIGLVQFQERGVDTRKEVLVAIDHNDDDDYAIQARLWRGGEVKYYAVNGNSPETGTFRYLRIPEGLTFRLQACRLNVLRMPLSCSGKVKVNSGRN